ncbi:MAG: phosphatidate cytidylyltransferase [Mariprofundaceae bacterium]
MNELSKRIITASVLFLLVIGWMFYIPSPWFERVSAVVGILASVELLAMLQMRNGSFYALAAAFAWAVIAVGLGVLVAIVVLMLSWAALLVFSSVEGVLKDDFKSFAYGQWMMLWLLLFIWSINMLHAQEQGVLFLSGACLGVWAADITAYFVGRKWGKRKLCPVISPGKTVEGFMGALIGGISAAMIFWVYMLDMSVVLACVLSLILVLVAVLGDLMESALKRVVDVKDSGNMLPGHGGLLDRIDALLPAIPVVGLLWMALA